MVAYSFKACFREPIRTLRKQQTIRADRKRHARPGEPVQLYTGMRTRQCLIIGRAICSAVLPVRIAVSEGWVEEGDCRIATARDLDAFATRDGFDDWPAMQAFWRQEHFRAAIFSGVEIRWDQFVEG